MIRTQKLPLTCLAALGAFLVACPISAFSQSYSRIETMTWRHDTSNWVLEQPSIQAATGLIRGAVVTLETDRVEYDARGLPWRTYKFGQLQQTLTYHTDGTLSGITDGNGNAISLSAWKRGIPQAIGAPDGSSLAALVNDDGTIAWTLNEVSAKHCYDYDGLGRVSGVTQPSETSNALCEATSAAAPSAWAKVQSVSEQVDADEYGIGAGHWHKSEAVAGLRRVTYFDALLRPLLVREYDIANPVGTERFKRYAYDETGRVIFASYPASIPSAPTGVWTEYDALGRVTSVSHDSERGLLVAHTSYEPGFVRRSTDANGNVTVERFQAFDSPTFDYPVHIDAPESQRTVIVRDMFGKPERIERGSRN